MTKPVLLLAVAALLPAAAGAQAPAKPAAKPAAPKTTPAPAAGGVPGVSPGGNAIILKMRQPEPETVALFKQQQGVAQQVGAVMAAPTVDIDKLDALLKQGESLRTQLQTRLYDRIIATARALPAADQKPFLLAIAGASVERARAAAGAR